MTEVQDLLIEIGTEELPPTALKRLSEAFAQEVVALLSARGLVHGEVERYATPRRLALLIRGLSLKQPDTESLRRGPAVSAAYAADGTPTKAALGFARSCGVAVEALERQETQQGSWLVHRSLQQGRATRDLLAELVAAALEKLPIPKRMRWGDSDVSFVRPVHWICMRFGAEVVPGTVMGVSIGGESRGHRFHCPEPLTIAIPAEYGAVLRAASVEPDFALRRDRIRTQVEALAQSVDGEAVMPADLVDEVTALCEWPVALLGHFDADFLQVPPEALIETMQQNQKYFPVRNRAGELLPHFIAVANIDSRDMDVVRAGNERVIRPRFADARFFWEQDSRRPLAERAAALEHIVFQHKLGSVAEKSRRVAAACRQIAEQLGYDADLAARAASLAKCDLVTAMVGEFAGLQGIMGRRYAENDGEDPCVCMAIEEQYRPRHAGDDLPTSECGRVLSLADKLDTLVGIFAIGERPTGVKDPYGLRRAAIGILRILIETPLPLDLHELLRQAAARFPAPLQADAAVTDAYVYTMDRLRGYYAEQGIGADAVDAVMAVDASRPSDFDRRVRAVSAFHRLESASALAAANKRIENIFKKSALPNAGDAGSELRQARLVDEAERQLASSLEALETRVDPLLAASDYATALATLAELRPDVDRFFDEVMVMDDDPELRMNRLALLNRVRALFLSIADISKLRPAARP
jgi:glycyl-tRNA synthetase beta chain